LGDGQFAATATTNAPVGCVPYFGDFNGDGKTDILWVVADANGRTVGPTQLWLALLNDWNFQTLPATTAPSGRMPYLAEFNGDGKTDILWDLEDTILRSQGTTDLWLSDGVAADLLTAVATGLTSTMITYESISTSTAYTKGTTATFPVIDFQQPLQIVTKVSASDGIGGTYSTTHSYSGAQLDLSGRGFLGFAVRRVTDLQTQLVETTSYSQVFPTTGLITSYLKTSGSTWLKSTDNSYQALDGGGTAITTVATPSYVRAPYRVQLSKSVENAYELDGSPLPGVVTTYAYDSFGNATTVTAQTGSATKTTVNTYAAPDTTNWYLGRLTGTTVTSTAP
jgi:hypothetical protein